MLKGKDDRKKGGGRRGTEGKRGRVEGKANGVRKEDNSSGRNGEIVRRGKMSSRMERERGGSKAIHGKKRRRSGGEYQRERRK